MTTTASIVVNYNSASRLRHLLESGGLKETDVYVVDNGSEPDEVRELCRAHNATDVLLPTNIGFAAAVNAAVAQLEPVYDEVLLVNPDVTLTADAVAALQAAREELDADAVCPVIIVEGTNRVQGGNGGGPLSVVALAAYYLFLTHLFPNWKGTFLTRAQTRRARRPLRLEWLCMACLLVRRDAFERYGGIPEDEIVYSEDIAWGTQASAAGAKLFLVPEVTVEHERGASQGSSYEAYFGSLTRLIRRRMTPARARVASAVVSTGLLVRRALGRPLE